MRTQSNFRQRIFWWMAFVGLVPLLGMAVYGYYWVLRDIQVDEQNHLIMVLDSRNSCARKIFEGLKEDFFSAGTSKCVQGLCQGHEPPPGLNAPLCNLLDALRTREVYYKGIATYDADWKIMATSRSEAINLLPPSSLKKSMQDNKDLVVYDEFVFTEDSVIAQVGQSVVDTRGDLVAYIFAILDISQLASSLVHDDSGLGKTGKIYVLSKNGRYIAPPEDSSGLMGKESGIPQSLIAEPGTAVMRYLDWRGVPVFGVSTKFPQIDMLMVAEIDVAEVFELPRHLIFSALVISLLTLVIVFFISILSSKSLSSSLRKLAQVAKTISAGNFTERVPPFPDKETQEVGDAFNQMLDRLEISHRAVINTESLAAVGELSSSIAHEMKSPLSSIKINLQAFGRKLSGDKSYLEMADISLQQVQRLEIMLAELLNYSKPLQLKPESLSFETLSQEVIHTMGQNVEQKGMTLTVENHLGGCKLHIDRELIVRALTALVDNAVQWSPPGGTITISGEKLAEKKSWFAIQVADEGPGIQARHRKRLFQPFFTTRPEGIGLGLANVRKIVEQHGGIIFAENKVPCGAVFILHLPLIVTELES